MLTQLQQFAKTAEPESEGILAGLGIDFTLLIIQGLAFLLMVFILSKWVYPVFMRILDEREEKIAESTKAAEHAQKAAEKAESNVADQLKQARKEAAVIVSTAKDEATAMIAKAEASAKTRSERIVTEAHEEITKEIEKARKTLEKDTLMLVKAATAVVTSHVADEKIDTALVKKSIEEAKK